MSAEIHARALSATLHDTIPSWYARYCVELTWLFLHP